MIRKIKEFWQELQSLRPDIFIPGTDSDDLHVYSADGGYINHSHLNRVMAAKASLLADKKGHAAPIRLSEKSPHAGAA